MAWVSGSASRTFFVQRPVDEVRGFFFNPERFKEAMSQLESGIQERPDVWRWVLIPKTELGITFQGDYTVEYSPETSRSSWRTLEGNMRSSGEVVVRERESGVEVEYNETLEVSLPVPKIMAKAFGPIVSREVRHGVGDFLDRAAQLLAT